MPNSAGPGMSGQFGVGRPICADATVYMACVISTGQAALCTWYVGVYCAVARVHAYFTKGAGSCDNANKLTNAEHSAA